MTPAEDIDMGKPRFAFLLLKEHPYGREMLMQIPVSYTHLTLPTSDLV